MAVVPTDSLPTAALKSSSKRKVPQDKKRWVLEDSNTDMEVCCLKCGHGMVQQEERLGNHHPKFQSLCACASMPDLETLGLGRRGFIRFGQSDRTGGQDLSNLSPLRAKVGSFYAARERGGGVSGDWERSLFLQSEVTLFPHQSHLPWGLSLLCQNKLINSPQDSEVYSSCWQKDFTSATYDYILENKRS